MLFVVELLVTVCTNIVNTFRSHNAGYQPALKHCDNGNNSSSSYKWATGRGSAQRKTINPIVDNNKTRNKKKSGEKTALLLSSYVFCTGKDEQEAHFRDNIIIRILLLYNVPTASSIHSIARNACFVPVPCFGGGFLVRFPFLLTSNST